MAELAHFFDWHMQVQALISYIVRFRFGELLTFHGFHRFQNICLVNLIMQLWLSGSFLQPARIEAA